MINAEFVWQHKCGYTIRWDGYPDTLATVTDMNGETVSSFDPADYTAPAELSQGTIGWFEYVTHEHLLEMGSI